MNVLDHGYIRLVDWMPASNCDGAIDDAARVSYGNLQTTTQCGSKDRDLIRFLMRHHHTSPFEMVEFKWCIKAPIFVARQWMRHRTASINEVSARYTDMGDAEFYERFDYRRQSGSNKQCSVEGAVDGAEDLRLERSMSVSAAVNLYNSEIAAGVCREQARTILPVGMYTEWVWKCDLHNTLGFLRQRLHPHAQYEIRVYAEFIYKTLKELCPITMEAFDDFVLNSITLTGLEVEALRNASANTIGLLGPSATKREQDEWMTKRKDLFVRTHQPSVP
jgi:thymidylate synthase (FAD)